MTRLEFRFWDNTLKKIIHRSLLPYDSEHPDIQVMRFTGFKDCNGVKIFQGDTLIDVDVVLEDGVVLKQTQQQVYWCEAMGAWMLDHTFKQDKKSGCLLSKELKDFRFKIFGNIYEI